jgi:PAS domain S-box-containing protein
LQKAVTKTSAKSNETLTPIVHVYIEGKLAILSGNWKWDMTSDAVFCSDVILPLPVEFIGTIGIIHPEDKAIVIERVELSKELPIPLEFRIITTYGEIKTLIGDDIVFVEEAPTSEDYIEKKLAEKAIWETDSVKQIERLKLKQQVNDFAASITQGGTWYINTTTNETYYSDQVFRILGLPPQSLNAHFHTFNQFIHPTQKEAVVEAIERSFELHLPLHIEYKILRPDNQERQVQYASQWIYSPRGEEVLCGVITDITYTKTIEEQSEAAEKNAALKNEIVQLHEQSGGLAHWQLDLRTRKTVFSDNLYKIYGLKPQSVPAGFGFFRRYAHPDDFLLVTEMIAQMVASRKEPNAGYRIIRADGKVRNIVQKGKLISLGNNHLVMAGIIADVTDETSLQENVKENSTQLELKELAWAVFEGVNEAGYWFYDVTKDKYWCSQQLYRLLGHKPMKAEFTEKLLTDSLHPADKKRVADILNITKELLTDNEVDFRILTKGETRYIKGVFKIITYNNLPYLIATLKDITTEKIQANEFDERIAIAEAVAENISDRIIITNLNHDIVFWNKACENIYNISREDVAGQNLFDVFPQLKNDEHYNLYNSVLQGKTTYIKDLPSAIRNEFIDLHLIALKNDEDKVTGILHIVHDVTKEYELQQNLAVRLGFIERVVDASVDRIISLDRNLNFVTWNKKSEEHFKRRKQQVLTKNILDVFPEIINSAFYAQLRKALKGELIHLPAAEGENNEGYFETYLIPVKDEKQEVNAVLWVAHDLSKELQLIEQERKANEIVNNIDVIFIELDYEYRFKFINVSAEAFLNKTQDKLLGKVFWEAFPQVKGKDAYYAIIKASTQRVKVEIEYLSTIYRRWIFMSITPTEDGVIILQYDRQDLKETYEQLKEEHRQMQEAQNIGHIGSFQWVADKNEIRWSDEMYRIHGLEPQSEALHLDRVLSFIHGEETSSLYEQLRLLREKANSLHVVHRLVRADGEVRRRQIQSFADENGKVTHLTGTIQDITEYENALKELRNSEQRAKTLLNVLEASPDAYLVLSHNFTMYMASHAYLQVTQTKRQDIIGKSFFDVFPDNPLNEKATGLRNLKASFEKVLQTRKPHRLPVQHYEIRIGDKSEDRYWSPINTPVLNSNGEVDFIIHRVVDVTELTKKQFQLSDLTVQSELLESAVDEIKLQSRKIQESKDLLQSVLQSSPNGILALEAVRNEAGEIIDLEYLMVNDSISSITQRSNMPGQRITEEFAGVKASGLFNHFVRVIETGEPWQEELLYNQDGLQMWLWVAGVKMNDGLVVTLQNITERKQAEDELKDSKRFVEQIALFTPDLITIHDSVSNEILFANNNNYWKEARDFNAIYQLRDEERSEALVHPDDFEKAKKFLKERRLLQDNEVKEVQLKMKGVIEYIKIRSKVFKRDENGNATQIISFTTDITESKKAEERLKESEHLLQQTTEATPDAITIFDLIKKQPLYLNNVLACWLCYSQKELVDMGFEGRLKLIHPGDRMNLKAHNKSMLLPTDGEVRSIEYRLKTKEGKIIWVCNRTKLFSRDGKGVVTHVLSVLQDISDRKS